MEHLNENGAASVADASTQSQASPGAMLREARERLGLSVADAAVQTKLAPRQIEALEADDFKHLPEIAFVRGFVRSYAKLLHLDAQPLLAALPQAKTVSHVELDSVEVPFPDAFSPQLQNLVWLGAALFLSVIVVAFAVWHYTSPVEPEKPEPQQRVESAIVLPSQVQLIPASAVDEAYASAVASAVPETQSPVPASYPPSVPTAAMSQAASLPASKQAMSAVSPALPAAVSAMKPAIPVAKPAQAAAAPKTVQAVPVTPAAKPVPPAMAPVAKSMAPAVKPSVPVAAQPANLRLKFGAESWTEVRDRNGSIVSSQLNPAGSELSLQGQGPFTLVVGRATSARLTYKGKLIDLKPHTNATSDVARVTLE